MYATQMYSHNTDTYIVFVIVEQPDMTSSSTSSTTPSMGIGKSAPLPDWPFVFG